MKLSSRSRYGTRLILDIALHGKDEPVKLTDIAVRQEISLQYLEQIMRPLKRAGYFKATRGIHGGYQLKRPPEEIRVGDIVALLERQSCLTPCAKKRTPCDRYRGCIMRRLWLEGAQAIFTQLNHMTLADLMSAGWDSSADEAACS